MKIKFKKLVSGAVIPQFARAGDAGLDLVATSFVIDEFGNLVYGTGLASELPETCVGLLFPRSSITKYGLILGNCVGVLDSGYRGEIFVKFKKFNNPDTQHLGEYKIGDRVAQIVFLELPKIEILESENLGKSERGTGGFGSTGN